MEIVVECMGVDFEVYSIKPGFVDKVAACSIWILMYF